MLYGTLLMVVALIMAPQSHAETVFVETDVLAAMTSLLPGGYGFRGDVGIKTPMEGLWATVNLETVGFNLPDSSTRNLTSDPLAKIKGYSGNLVYAGARKYLWSEAKGWNVEGGLMYASTSATFETAGSSTKYSFRGEGLYAQGGYSFFESSEFDLRLSMGFFSFFSKFLLIFRHPLRLICRQVNVCGFAICLSWPIVHWFSTLPPRSPSQGGRPGFCPLCTNMGTS